MQSHDADSEDCLIIFHNSVKSKAIEDLCERWRELMHKELLSHDSDTVNYKDIRNNSRNMHTARSYKLFPLKADIYGTH